jgi:hypothetical protein
MVEYSTHLDSLVSYYIYVMHALVFVYTYARVNSSLVVRTKISKFFTHATTDTI